MERGAWLKDQASRGDAWLKDLQLAVEDDVACRWRGKRDVSVLKGVAKRAVLRVFSTNEPGQPRAALPWR